MAASVDTTNLPYVHVSGTTAEVLGHLKSVGVPRQAVIAIWYNGTNTSCVYRK